MAKIFKEQQGAVQRPNRNTFDLSFQNNGSYKLGYLYPVFCKEVIPGDSFRIQTTFGLNFQPMVFPVQTRINANIHYFYVRNRNLWKDWMDFFGKTKDNLTPPYLSIDSDRAKSELCTGSLADYLGVPTTSAGQFGNGTFIYPYMQSQLDSLLSSRHSGNHRVSSSARAMVGTNTTATLNRDLDGSLISTAVTGSQSYELPQVYSSELFAESFVGISSFSDLTTYLSTHDYVQFSRWVPRPLSGYNGFPTYPFEPVGASVHNLRCACNYFYCNNLESLANSKYIIWSHPELTTAVADFDEPLYLLILNDEYVDSSHAHRIIYAGDCPVHYDFTDEVATGTLDTTAISAAVLGKGYSRCTLVFVPQSASSGLISIQNTLGYLAHLDGAFTAVSDNAKLQDNVNMASPFVDYGSGPSLPISALPFRAYESIYNSFYRNQQNDPFTINGTPEYNKYIPTNLGGADTTSYTLHRQNWELDFLTSALPSPQQGIAPLVGVSSTGVFTFEDAQGQQYTAKAVTGSDGHTLTGINVQSENFPQGSLRAMVDMISHGISINDFRNVNSLQRWLETNMRRGLKYKDQLLSHFGVDATYDELDMPEFIGGISRPVTTNKVTDTSSESLGQFAGQSSVVGQSEFVEKYCDESGFIIGILSIVPVPNYSQLMPRHLLKNQLLDYYFPEFSKIGLQPIPNKEVCPIQNHVYGIAHNTDIQEDTFGYQRYAYEYISSVDEVHGDLRLSLHNYVMNRYFNEPPQLGKSFLQIDDAQLNDVFADTSVNDKIVGQIYFDVQAKRPIPRIIIPALE